MKNLGYILLILFIGSIVISGCKEDEIVLSPEVPHRIEFNETTYHNGDSLYGRVVVEDELLVEGMVIKKIDCRLGNIVIGTVENEKEVHPTFRVIRQSCRAYSLSSK